MTIVNLEPIDSDINWVYYSKNNHIGVIREILNHVNLSGKFLFIIDSFVFKNLKGQQFSIYTDIF